MGTEIQNAGVTAMARGTIRLLDGTLIDASIRFSSEVDLSFVRESIARKACTIFPHDKTVTTWTNPGRDHPGKSKLYGVGRMHVFVNDYPVGDFMRVIPDRTLRAVGADIVIGNGIMKPLGIHVHGGTVVIPRQTNPVSVIK
nr:hypothetical protein [Candidatus Sigynarchaeota archaeon]